MQLGISRKALSTSHPHQRTLVRYPKCELRRDRYVMLPVDVVQYIQAGNARSAFPPEHPGTAPELAVASQTEPVAAKAAHGLRTVLQHVKQSSEAGEKAKAV